MAELIMAPPVPSALVDMLPWTTHPLITSAPMRGAAYAKLAVAVSRAGGLGFIGAGYDVHEVEDHLNESVHMLQENPLQGSDVEKQLPVGVGIIVHKADLKQFIHAITPSLANQYRAPPAAVWLFAPHEPRDLTEWSCAIRAITLRPGQKAPQVWVQVGSASEAVPSLLATSPEVLVIQGADAGGHGLSKGASIVSLLPECIDSVQLLCSRKLLSFAPRILAAGGIADGRGVGAALALGAEGVSVGTLFLASPEAQVAQGYREAVVEASDGGLATVRSRVYDSLRGTDFWPRRFGARGVTNESWVEYQRSGLSGMEDNRKQYAEALANGDAGWGQSGRLTTYAGTGVGLIRYIRPAGDIVKDLRAGSASALATANANA